MRFVSFESSPGRVVAGVIVAGAVTARVDAAPANGAPANAAPPDADTPLQVADLSHPACRGLMGTVAPTLQALIDDGLATWSSKLAQAQFDADALRTLDAGRLCAPLPRPGKIIGAAFNFRDALAERGMAAPAEPVTFVRSGRTVIGPGTPILVPPDVGHLTYEAELAVVIGRTALRVPRAEAMRYVAGYTAHNDVSGVDLTRNDGGFVRGKNLPSSAPLGPWLVPADALTDPYDLAIRLDIDGRRLQNGSTADMLFDIATLIEYVSHRMPLDPGDVIATGTPAGVAAMHQPPAWLAPGTTVTVEVGGFGRLSNPVRAGSPFLQP